MFICIRCTSFRNISIGKGFICSFIVFVHLLFIYCMVNENNELFSEVLVSLNFNYYLYQNCLQLILFLVTLIQGKLNIMGC